MKQRWCTVLESLDFQNCQIDKKLTGVGSAMLVFLVFLGVVSAGNWTQSFYYAGFVNAGIDMPQLAVEQSTKTVVVLTTNSLLIYELSSGALRFNVTADSAFLNNPSQQLFASRHGYAVVATTDALGTQLSAQTINLTSGSIAYTLTGSIRVEPITFSENVVFSSNQNRLTVLGTDGLLQTWNVAANGTFSKLYQVDSSSGTRFNVDPNGDLFSLNCGLFSCDVLKVAGSSGALVWQQKFGAVDCEYTAVTTSSFYVSCGFDTINILDSTTGAHSTASTGGGALTFLWGYATDNSSTAVMSFSQYVDQKRGNSGFGVLALIGSKVLWNTPAGIQDESVLTMSGDSVFVWYSSLILDRNTGATIGRIPSWTLPAAVGVSVGALGTVVSIAANYSNYVISAVQL